MKPESLAKIRRFLMIDLPIMIILIWGITWWQSRNLVDKGTTIPDFALLNTSETMVYASDMKGKPTLLYFFAPWCGICNQTAPSLAKSFKDRDDVQFFMIGLSYDSVSQLESFGEKHGVPPQNILIGNDKIQELFAIEQFPTMYVLNKDAQIEESGVGLAKAYLIKYFGI